MEYRFKMLPSEAWWGGTAASDQCPLTDRSDYHQDFTRECGNQTRPFVVSSLGR